MRRTKRLRRRARAEEDFARSRRLQGESGGPDTITVAHDGGKKSISYKVHKFTEISVEGKRCQLDSVKVGMEVLVIAGTDPTVAASIKAERAD